MPALPVLDHLIALSDDVGIIQHALRDVPNRSTGYCTDDVARAFMVALQAIRAEVGGAIAERLAGIYLAFVADAQMRDGRFHNFMGYDRNWQDGVGTEDSFGRAVWALGFGAAFAPRPTWRALCAEMLDRALPHVGGLRHLRARAYAALGLAHAIPATSGKAQYREALSAAIAALQAAFVDIATPDWQWCERTMTYDNARLCEALLRGGTVLDEGEALAAGMQMLAFYERVVFENGIFVPIGNDGWYPSGGPRARYGQQPLEAAAMIDAELLAGALDGDAAHAEAAERAFAWYLGRNTAETTMVADGGCHDGIDVSGVNANMGAESTLAYLAGAFAVAYRSTAPPRQNGRSQRIELSR